MLPTIRGEWAICCQHTTAAASRSDRRRVWEALHCRPSPRSRSSPVTTAWLDRVVDAPTSWRSPTSRPGSSRRSCCSRPATRCATPPAGWPRWSPTSTPPVSRRSRSSCAAISTSCPPTCCEAADRLGFPVLLLPDDAAFDDLLNSVVAEYPAAPVDRPAGRHRRPAAGVGRPARGRARRAGRRARTTSIGGRHWSRPPTGGCWRRSATTTRLLAPGRTSSSSRGGSGPSGSPRASTVRATVRWRSSPVMAGKADHGRLVVDPRRGRCPGLATSHVLERAATVFALAITKSMAVQAVEAKYRGDFVRDVLIDRAGPTESVVDHFAFAWAGTSIGRSCRGRGRASTRSARNGDEARGRQPPSDRAGAVRQRVGDVSWRATTGPPRSWGSRRRSWRWSACPTASDARPIVDRLVHAVSR